MLNEVFELFADCAREKKISLTINFTKEFLDTIHSDPTRLRQIFISIVGNVIKFADEGGVK